MSKRKIYKINKNNVSYTNNGLFIEFIVGIIVYAIVLLMANSLFKGIYVDGFLFAVVAALILSFLNSTIKPFLVFLTMPLSIITFGIAYPIVNMIILKICDLVMGSAFELNGFFATFFIAIFISALKMFLDFMITKRVGK